MQAFESRPQPWHLQEDSVPGQPSAVPSGEWDIFVKHAQNTWDIERAMKKVTQFWQSSFASSLYQSTYSIQDQYEKTGMLSKNEQMQVICFLVSSVCQEIRGKDEVKSWHLCSGSWTPIGDIAHTETISRAQGILLGGEGKINREVFLKDPWMNMTLERQGKGQISLERGESSEGSNLGSVAG